MEIGEQVTLLPFHATGRIESVYHDRFGQAVYTVRMDDPGFVESGYMLARREELDD